MKFATMTQNLLLPSRLLLATPNRTRKSCIRTLVNGVDGRNDGALPGALVTTNGNDGPKNRPMIPL